MSGSASGTSTFTGGISARRLDVAKGVSFTGATFGGNAYFNNGRIGGMARFDGTQFAQLANFDEIRVEGWVYFAHPNGKPATFRGVATFLHVRFELSTFSRVQFGGEGRFAAQNALPVENVRLVRASREMFDGQYAPANERFDDLHRVIGGPIVEKVDVDVLVNQVGDDVVNDVGFVVGGNESDDGER